MSSVLIKMLYFYLFFNVPERARNFLGCCVSGFRYLIVEGRMGDKGYVEGRGMDSLDEEPTVMGDVVGRKGEGGRAGRLKL